MKKTDGFTLIELLVGILCAALITGAAMSTLLMGARVNRSLNDANSDQQNSRIIMSFVESLASEGGIHTVEVRGALESSNENAGTNYDDGKRDWALLGEDQDGNGSEDTILYYSPADKSIYTGDGSVLMDGIIASSLTLSNQTLDGSLLGFVIQTEESLYDTAVYCRSSKIKTDGIVLDESNLSITVSDKESAIEGEQTTQTILSNATDGRFAFLAVLCSQYGSTGEIYGTNQPETFNLWYCGGNKYWAKWNAETPWCAVFLSWAVAQIGPNVADRGSNPQYLTTIPKESIVDKLASCSELNYYDRNTESYALAPGDLIFFSWDADSELEHVGAVFATDANYVYTIEGNSSGKVALRRYDLDDESIMGYGVLNWTTTTPET